MNNKFNDSVQHEINKHKNFYRGDIAARKYKDELNLSDFKKKLFKLMTAIKKFIEKAIKDLEKGFFGGGAFGGVYRLFRPSFFEKIGALVRRNLEGALASVISVIALAGIGSAFSAIVGPNMGKQIASVIGRASRAF